MNTGDVPSTKALIAHACDDESLREEYFPQILVLDAQSNALAHHYYHCLVLVKPNHAHVLVSLYPDCRAYWMYCSNPILDQQVQLLILLQFLPYLFCSSLSSFFALANHAVHIVARYTVTHVIARDSHGESSSRVVGIVVVVVGSSRYSSSSSSSEACSMNRIVGVDWLF